jgi:hypothetical protein
MKNPTELMQNAKLGIDRKLDEIRINALKLAFKNELEFLKDTYGTNGFNKKEEFDNIILDRRKELKQAIKLAEGIQ